MFGAVPAEGAKDDAQRQARSFLLQTPPVLSSALAGANVAGSFLLFLTRHDPSHDQEEGIHALAGELVAASFAVLERGVLRLIADEEGVHFVPPPSGKQWPPCIAKLKQDVTTKLTVIPLDAEGNDLRPLYFLPWMPDAECEAVEYNRRAFGNRILGTAVVHFGRSPVEQDVVLRFDDLLNESTDGIYRRWRNKSYKGRLREQCRNLLLDHLRKVSGIMFSDPNRDGQSVAVKVPDEKTKRAIIRAFRDELDKEWNKPADPSLFDKQEDQDE